MAYLIVGLGNPGEEYALSRHNTGRLILENLRKTNDFPSWAADKKLEALVSRGKINGEAVALIMPETMMNNSGRTVARLINTKKQAEKLLVIYDDIDLPLGLIKFSWNKSDGGHRGLASVIRAAKTKAFLRGRIGICPTSPTGKLKKPEAGEALLDFILKPFREAELKQLKALTKRVNQAVECWLEFGPDKTMSLYSR